MFKFNPHFKKLYTLLPFIDDFKMFSGFSPTCMWNIKLRIG
uniref:Uncharacterized protein n=1 Tax=Anguilla anguilla TaxID=7936 RepID=A0A0E9VAR4_ANGAN